jgi:hypothetical protein
MERIRSTAMVVGAAVLAGVAACAPQVSRKDTGLVRMALKGPAGIVINSAM